ncbi:MAG: hypothetical protein PHT15_00305 [Gallionellaceae bacterium]|nr:hypothetical protein [Gallionellaceae bacterium]
MKLPNGTQAVVDIEKLRDYCLNSDHPEGRHKARVFLSTLGMMPSDAADLRQILLDAAIKAEDVVMSSTDEYGRRYFMDHEVMWNNRVARIRSAWIVRSGENLPRLTTCYVVRGEK